MAGRQQHKEEKNAIQSRTKGKATGDNSKEHISPKSHIEIAQMSNVSLMVLQSYHHYGRSLHCPESRGPPPFVTVSGEATV